MKSYNWFEIFCIRWLYDNKYDCAVITNSTDNPLIISNFKLFITSLFH